MAEAVQVDCLTVYGVTAAVVVAVGREGWARVTRFEDVGFFALAPDVEGLRCAAHVGCFQYMFRDLWNVAKLRWLGVLLIDARYFRFE